MNLSVHVVMLISLFLARPLCFAGIYSSWALRKVHYKWMWNSCTSQAIRKDCKYKLKCSHLTNNIQPHKPHSINYENSLINLYKLLIPYRMFFVNTHRRMCCEALHVLHFCMLYIYVFLGYDFPIQLKSLSGTYDIRLIDHFNYYTDSCYELWNM